VAVTEYASIRGSRYSAASIAEFDTEQAALRYALRTTPRPKAVLKATSVSKLSGEPQRHRNPASESGRYCTLFTSSSIALTLNPVTALIISISAHCAINFKAIIPVVSSTPCATPCSLPISSFFRKVEPLIKRTSGDIVKAVDFDQVILKIERLDALFLEQLFLFFTDSPSSS
jgi:hypothetical protein